MASFSDLVAKLRSKKVVRYEELIVASVVEVTKVQTTWSKLRKMYSNDPAAFIQLERRMFRMLPARYHDSVRVPRKDTKSLLKKSKKEVRKNRKEFVAKISIRPAVTVSVHVSDEPDDNALKQARQQAQEQRDAKNKVARKFNREHFKRERAAKKVIALLLLYAVMNPRKRKLAPVVTALLSKPVKPYKLAQKTLTAIENIQGRRGMKERAEALKREAEKEKAPTSKLSIEEAKYWESMSMKQLQSKHKYQVGDKVRRDKKIWPGNRPHYFGVILELVVGETNNGRKRPAYKVQWNKSELGPSTFIEEELQLQKTGRKK